jgi:hypothetical protein
VPLQIDKAVCFGNFMVKLSDILKIEQPDVLSSRYGKAFEKAVLALIKTKDTAVAMRTFIEHYGEPHTGRFRKADEANAVGQEGG